MTSNSLLGPALQIRPSIALKQGAVTCLGSGADCDRQLLHPLIAARHVEFILGSGKASLRDLGSMTFVNGQKVLSKSVPIEPGDQIDIGPYLFLFTGLQLESVASMDYVQLNALGLSRVVSNGRSQRTLFDKITLVFHPGEFTCLLGPSGCGKSSLMAALSGRAAPTSGTVRVNQRDLSAQFEAVKRYIVLVPQKPLLHSALTVNQALRFTARLRLPASADRATRVDGLLAAMKLEDRRKNPISILSGGQEKRLCLANELISDPGLIFLDEVTSGLDEHIDADLMHQFKDLAEKDRKTIICVTHSLANVRENCHQVVFLAPGGRLAFVGSPDAALEYFKVDKLGDVYPLLSAENAQQLAAGFAESDEYRAYLNDRIPESERAGAEPTLTPPTRSEKRHPRIRWLSEAATFARQASLLTHRQLILLAKDRWTLLSLLGQVLLVALVLGLSFGVTEAFPKMSKQDQKYLETWNRLAGESKDRILHKVVIKQMEWVRRVLNLTFLVGVTSFWFGCNNAAREIVRERAITRQEQSFNLRPLAYFFSKLAILTAISWVQVGLLLFAVWYLCKPPNLAIGYLSTVLALAFVGTTLGLLISSISASESVAVTLIPIAVIPQIILAGAFQKLQGAALVTARIFVTTYWGKLAMDAKLTGEGMKFARDERFNMIEPLTMAHLPMAIILLHAAVFSVLTVAALSSDGSIGGIMGRISSWLTPKTQRSPRSST